MDKIKFLALVFLALALLTPWQAIGSPNAKVNLLPNQNSGPNRPHCAQVQPLDHNLNHVTCIQQANTSDLAVTMSDSPDPTTTGNELTYEITVNNFGPSTATEVTVVDALPTGVTFVSAIVNQGSCQQADGNITCHLGAIANGETATLRFVVTPQTAGTLSNVANVSSGMPDINLGNNTAQEQSIVMGNSITPIPTHSPTTTPTFTSTNTPSNNSTPTPTNTPSNSSTPTSTATSIATATHTPTTINTPSLTPTTVPPSAPNLAISSVSPNYGLDDVPTLLYLHGSGFTEPLTVKLGNNSLTVEYIESEVIAAVVPSGLDPAFYDVTVETTTGQATLTNGYQVLEAAVIDDLLSFPEWLWTNPFPLRVGYAESSVGLIVQHLGSRSSLDSVTVEFRLDRPDGQIIGRSMTNLLGPFATESTGPVIWEPATDGEYTICAIIDPDNQIEETNEENNTTCRTLIVLPIAEDIIPPEIDNFIMADGAQSTSEIDITLNVATTDYPIPGASGIKALKFIEFEYMLGARRWVPVQQPGWVDYLSTEQTYPWSLKPTYGMRYMQAWAIDHANNISLEPGASVIDLLPSEQTGSVARHGVVFFRVYLEEGENFTSTLTPRGGDPDLYIWGANGQLWHSNNVTGVEAITFEAPKTGTYQIEVHGYSEAEYHLTFGDMTLMQTNSSQSKSRGSKPLPHQPSVPLEEWPQYYAIDPPATYTLYLPLSIR